MGHYVYRYVHKDYPWLYVGKTDTDLITRLNTHMRSKDDNISRDYLPLLKASKIQYIELNSSTQSDYVEKLIIDKYKPTLNKKDKNGAVPCIDFTLPEWKDFDVADFAPKQMPVSNIVNRLNKGFDYDKSLVFGKGKVTVNEIFNFFAQSPKSMVKFVSVMYDEMSNPITFQITKFTARIIYKSKTMYTCKTDCFEWVERAESFSMTAGFYPNTLFAYQDVIDIEIQKQKSLELELSDLKLSKDYVPKVEVGQGFYLLDCDNAIIGNGHYVDYGIPDDLCFSYSMNNYGGGGCRAENNVKNTICQMMSDERIVSVYKFDDRILNFQQTASRIKCLRETMSVLGC